MGYNTSYSLGVRPECIDAIRALREASEEANYCLEADGSPGESGKWYDHEVELREISKKFPEKVFVLRGKGEAPEDLWEKYFSNGKMQLVKARIVYDTFNPKLLK